jgi:hypothetical protein
VDWSRSNLGGGGGNQPSPAKAPTVCIIVGAISCKRRRQTTTATTTQDGNTTMMRRRENTAVHAILDDNSHPRPTKFRKWGDEPLSQVVVVNEEMGETRAKLLYPAVAPPMPPELQAMIANSSKNS